jgi:Ca-activated chloride channel family protein
MTRGQVRFAIAGGAFAASLGLLVFACATKEEARQGQANGLGQAENDEEGQLGKGPKQPSKYEVAKPAASDTRPVPPRGKVLDRADPWPTPEFDPFGTPHVFPRLDPNARYATTYRPGGAALAAFDAAVQRGSVPSIYRDLVGDFGARYAPELPKPNGALSFQIDTERAALAPQGGSLALRIAMRSSDAFVTHAPLSVHLVLDVSGSMNGDAIENAKKAAETLVRKLDPLDDFSMITFSSEAQVLVPDDVVGERRDDVLRKIDAVHADGGTNISAGLDLGYKEAHKTKIREDAIKVVMLLSDGHANAGETASWALSDRAARAFQDGIQTSTFGLGADFDAPLMSSIADRGAGAYYYLADSTQIALALTRELDARLVPVAQAVEVRVRLRPDVAPTRVYGSRMLDGAETAAVREQEKATDKLVHRTDGIKEDRETDAEGGMRFFIPAFARDDRHAMLLAVRMPAGAGERAVGSVEVRYKDRVVAKNVTQEMPVRIKYADSEAKSASTANAAVLAAIHAFSAGDAILAAADQVDRGDRTGAARVLEDRAKLLEEAAQRLGSPSLGDDAVRLARLARAVSGAEQIADPVPLAVMLRGSAYGYLR